MPTIAQSNYVTYSTTTAPVVTIDSGATEGQLLVAFIGDSAVPLIAAIPTGWENPVGGVSGADSIGAVLYCLTHRITSAEQSGSTTSWTLTGLYSSVQTGWVTAVVIDDVNETQPIDAVNIYWSNTVTTTHVLPGLDGDALHDDSLVISCVASDGARNYSSAPTGWTFVDNTSTATPGMAVLSKNSATVAGVDIAAENITVNSTDECESITLAFTDSSQGPPAPSCALVQSATGSANATTSLAATLGSTPISGNLLVVNATWRNTNTTPSISGSGWSTAITHSVVYNSPRYQAMFWKEAGGSEPTTVTLTLSPATQGTVVVSEYSGLTTPTLAAVTPSSTPLNFSESRVVYNLPAISAGPGIAVNSMWAPASSTMAAATSVLNGFTEVTEVTVASAASQHVAWRELNGEELDVTAVQLGANGITINVAYVFVEDGEYCLHPYLYLMGEVSEFATGTTITTVIPTGAAADDYMVLALMCNESTTFSTPSGWTEIGTAIESNANQSTKWFAKVHDGSESNPASTTSATLSGTIGGFGRILVYRNVDTAGPIEDVTMAGSPTNTNAPLTSEITTTDDHRLVVALMTVDNSHIWNDGLRPPPLWAAHSLQSRTDISANAGFEGVARYMPYAGTVPAVRRIGQMASSPYWRTLTMGLIPTPVEAAIAAYTELEWSIGIQPPAEDADVYEFRVYLDDEDTPLDTYAVTPQLTVEAPAEPITVAIPPAILRLTAQTPTAAGTGATSTTIVPATVQLTGVAVDAAGETVSATVPTATVQIAASPVVAAGTGTATSIIPTAAMRLLAVPPLVVGAPSTAAIPPATVYLNAPTPTGSGSGATATAIASASLELAARPLTAAGSGTATAVIATALLRLSPVTPEGATTGATALVPTATLYLTPPVPVAIGVGVVTTPVPPALLLLLGVAPYIPTGLMVGMLTCDVDGPGVRRLVGGPALLAVLTSGPAVEPVDPTGPQLTVRTALGPALTTRLVAGPTHQTNETAGPDVSRDMTGPAIEDVSVTGPGACNAN